MIKILTGGQTGVDTGAALAARLSGVPWACVLPAGYRREEPMPDWMREHSRQLASPDYAYRTRWCVDRADAVLCYAPHRTPGTQLTHRYAKRTNKPNLWLTARSDVQVWDRGRDWIRGLGSITLMVAGPRESRWPGAMEETLALMTWVFSSGDAGSSARTPPRSQ